MSPAKRSSPADPDSTPEADSDSDLPLGYEAARAELRDIVAALESGGQPLEESLELWERGEALAEICRRWLDGASERLDQAIAAADGALGPSAD